MLSVAQIKCCSILLSPLVKGELPLGRGLINLFVTSVKFDQFPQVMSHESSSVGAGDHMIEEEKNLGCGVRNK